MHIPLIQVEWAGHRIQSLRPDRVLGVRPAVGRPKGYKGEAMADAWAACRPAGAAGILWMDPDIVADLGDLETMHECIAQIPEAVWVAPHKLWPASTGRQEWVWGHGPWAGTAPGMTQDLERRPGWFAMGFTFTPAELLDLAWADLRVWEYGMIDMGLSRYAREAGIPIKVAYGACPRHVHFYPDRGGPR